MKRLILLFVLFFAVITVNGQVFFGHVPERTIEKGLLDNGEFMFSLDAVIAGPTWTFENNFDKPIFLQGAAIAIGYKHFKADLKSDWGISLALTNKFQLGDEQTQQVGIALLPNYYNLMVGPVYFFGNKYPGIMVGGSVTF